MALWTDISCIFFDFTRNMAHKQKHPAVLKVSHKGTAKNILFCFSGTLGLPGDPGGFVNICGHFSACLIPTALKAAHEKLFEWTIHLYFLVLINCLEDNNICIESARKSIWFNVLFMLNRNSFYFVIMPLNQTISSEFFLQDLAISFSWIPNNSVMLYTLLYYCSPFTDYLWMFVCPSTETYGHDQAVWCSVYIMEGREVSMEGITCLLSRLL